MPLPDIPHTGAHVIETTGLPDGFVPPSGSLNPPTSQGSAVPETVDATTPPPSVGRVVHYATYDEGRRVCLAAIVTKVDTYQESSSGQHIGHVDLCVLSPVGFHFGRGVFHDEGKSDCTWHWPERVQAGGGGAGV